jgi:hypothetical protein
MQDMQQYRQHSDEPKRAGVREGGRAGPDEDKAFSSTDASGLEHPLIPSKRVNGASVFNQSGEEVGKIEDIAIDKVSGKVAYAILSFGGFMGLGEKHQPLPWSALDYDERRGGYVVDVTEEFLRLAPKLDVSELSGWDDADQRDAFYSYYAAVGARPYW